MNATSCSLCDLQTAEPSEGNICTLFLDIHRHAESNEVCLTPVFRFDGYDSEMKSAGHKRLKRAKDCGIQTTSVVFKFRERRVEVASVDSFQVQRVSFRGDLNAPRCRQVEI